MVTAYVRKTPMNIRFLRVRQGQHKKKRVDKLLTLFFQSAHILPVKPRLFIIGDSTSHIYTSSVYWRCGWAQAIKNKFVTDCVQVCDITMSDRSSKSFYCEGHWATVKNLLRKGDCIIIQFGHNDENNDDVEKGTLPGTTFKRYLSIFIDDAIAMGAIPILATPIERNIWKCDNITLNDSHITANGDYPLAVRELAADKKVGLIDATSLTKRFFEAIGKTTTASLFAHPSSGEWLEYMNDNTDNIPLNEYGTKAVAQLIADDIVRQKLVPLYSWVKGSVATDCAQTFLQYVSAVSMISSDRMTCLPTDSDAAMDGLEVSGNVIETLFNGRLCAVTSTVTCRPSQRDSHGKPVLYINGKPIGCTFGEIRLGTPLIREGVE